MQPMEKKNALPIAVLLTLSTLSPFYPPTASATPPPQVHRFSNIYEPSGVVYHPSGNILIIEDRESTPLYITRFSSPADKNKTTLDQPTSLPLATSAADLEGCALGKDGMVFLITSFSASKKGKVSKKRKRLILLKIVDGQIIHEQYSKTFPANLTAQLKNENHFSKTDIATLNIEGLAFDKDKKHLLLGLRTPLRKGKSILLVIKNPYEIFSKNASPKFSSKDIELNLDGGGIRAITYDQTLQAYLIANEVKNNKGKLRPQLWTWDGNPQHEAQKVSLPKMKGVKNFEGISPVKIKTKNFLLLVCDDGEEKKGKGAHYILLDYAHLR